MSDCSKVYCVQCAYFNSCKRSNARVSYDETNLHEICNAPQNIRSTYLSDGSNKYISSPSIINKYNNCKWFAAKVKCNDTYTAIDKHNRDPKSHPYLIEKINELDNKFEEADIRIQHNLDLHTSNVTNPHNVTKAQVGLDQVDNTSDINKPVSRLTNEALATLKSDLEELIDEKTSGTWHYRGKVNYKRDLESIVIKSNGDIYTVLYKDDGTPLNSEFIWTGEKWEEIGSIIDIKDYYKKFEVDALLLNERTYIDGPFFNSIVTRITGAKDTAISEAINRDIDVIAHCEQYTNDKIVDCKSYTDEKVASLSDRHYSIKTVTSSTESPNEYLTVDYTTNNIDLTGKTGVIYIYLPPTITSLNGRAREFIINVSNRSSGVVIHFATKNGEIASFRDGGILQTIKTEKEEFSLKFQEYDTSKFLVDQTGIGNSIDYTKIKIDGTQMTLKDSAGTGWQFSVVDGQLKLSKVTA